MTFKKRTTPDGKPLWKPTWVDDWITDTSHLSPARFGWAAIKALFKHVIFRLASGGAIPAEFATWLIQRGGLKDA